MGSGVETKSEAARWLALGSGAGFATSVGLLPWARVSGTLVGDKQLTFWDIRPGIETLDGLWSYLGVPAVLIGITVVGAWAIAMCAGIGGAEDTGPGDLLPLAAVPGVWAALVIFQINDAVSQANRLGLGNLVTFDVGVGAWSALICGIGLLAAAYLHTTAMSQGAGADVRRAAGPST